VIRFTPDFNLNLAFVFAFGQAPRVLLVRGAKRQWLVRSRWNGKRALGQGTEAPLSRLPAGINDMLSV